MERKLIEIMNKTNFSICYLYSTSFYPRKFFNKPSFSAFLINSDLFNQIKSWAELISQGIYINWWMMNDWKKITKNLILSKHYTSLAFLYFEEKLNSSDFSKIYGTRNLVFIYNFKFYDRLKMFLRKIKFKKLFH